MKKVLSAILIMSIILSVLSIIPITTNAVTCGDYEYDLLDNGTVEITKYYGSTSVLTISNSLHGKLVTSIGESAFEDCTTLTSVEIPDSVTSIGKDAFSRCKSLKSLTIPNSVKKISNYAFFYCTSLTSVTIGNGLTSIGGRAFDNCTSLTSIVIPDSVVSIGNRAFANCTSLINIDVSDNNKYFSSLDGNLYNKEKTELLQYAPGKKNTSFNFPDSVTIIGDCAFFYCSNLISIDIPDNVISIGEWAFIGCTSLMSVSVPDSVQSLGGSAFYNTAFYNNESNWEGDVLYIGSHLTAAKNTIWGDYNIKEETLCIADYAFADCTALNSITIPESVTYVGKYAFDNCSNLASIDVSDNNKNYSSINGNLYNKDKTQLLQYSIGKEDTSFIIPDSVTIICNYAFYRCTNLKSITVPNSTTSIGDSAFEGCRSLTSVTIGNNVTSIGNRAFQTCKNLAYVYYSGSEENWKKIDIGENNSCLTNATINYLIPTELTGPSESTTIPPTDPITEPYESTTIPLTDPITEPYEPTTIPLTDPITEPYEPTTIPPTNETTTLKAEEYVELSGTITSDMYLNDPSKKYILKGHVDIAKDVSLKVSNGVTINGNDMNINVYGSLNADNSTFLDTNIYARNKNYSPCSIVMYKCNMEGGSLLYPTGDSGYCNLRLLQNNFSNLYGYSYIWYPSSDTYIEGNVFDNCGYLSIGSRNNVYVQYNDFINIKEKVIINWAAYNCQCYFRYNNIYPSGNSKRIVGLQTGGYSNSSMIATNNYWNTTDVDKVSTYILDEKSDYSCAGTVEYLPISNVPFDKTTSVTPETNWTSTETYTLPPTDPVEQTTDPQTEPKTEPYTEPVFTTNLPTQLPTEAPKPSTIPFTDLITEPYTEPIITTSISTTSVQPTTVEPTTAVPTEGVTDSSEPNSGNLVYFDATGWKNVTMIYCHIWKRGGNAFIGWQLKKEACKKVSGNTWSYDLANLEASTTMSGGLKSGEDYCIIFSAQTGKQTYDATFSKACIGDTLKLTGKQIENPVDYEKKSDEAVWTKNSGSYGPHLAFTSIGNIVGSKLCPNEKGIEVIGDWLPIYYKSSYIKDKVAALAKAYPELGITSASQIQDIYAYILSKRTGEDETEMKSMLEKAFAKAYPIATPDEPDQTTATTNNITEPVVETKMFSYLPSAKQAMAGYNYKIAIQDKSGGIKVYSMIATDKIIDGIRLYSVEIPIDEKVSAIYYQVYDGDTWISQVAVNPLDAGNNTITADGTVYNETEETTSTDIVDTSATSDPTSTQTTTVEVTKPSNYTPTVISKKPNPIKITVKAKTIKAKKLKKKAQTVKAITVKNAQGKVTYKLVKSRITRRIRKLVKINSKGVMTIKKWKKAKRGVYKIKVKIKTAGNANYRAKSVTKTLKVRIK
jgi:hypothetical protein